MTAFRKERVESQLLKELSLIIQRKVKDPRIQGIHLVSVKISPDFSLAHVSYSALSAEADIKEIQRGLDSAKPMMRKEVRKVITIRKIPELVFKFDSSIIKGDEILGILRNIHYNFKPEELDSADKHSDEQDSNPEDDTSDADSSDHTDDSDDSEDSDSQK
ncbi:MAG: 30S ribosome-binding factor RbfA [Candidatus Riflebacteria bacterium]|nr:30S ribosome-binding factor RbfA [Candidatus Riflebacteria bacterium]